LEFLITSHVGPITVQRAEPNGAGSIAVQLDGPPRNPDGLGSRVDIHVEGHVFTRVVAMGTDGLYSALEPRIHLGLGHRTAADKIVVTWPDGAQTVLEDVTGGRIVRIGYGD
jgi:hypothetical protein